MKHRGNHHKPTTRVRATGVILVAVLMIALPVFAKQKNAEINVSSSGIYTAGLPSITYMELRITDPSGQMIFQTRTDGSPIAWGIPSGAPDGFYSYEVRLGKEPKKVKRENINRQGLGPKTKSLVESGSFLIENGSIVLPAKEETSLLDTVYSTGRYALKTIFDFIAAPAAADQVILDDLIVQFSTCVGQDCVNGESFGFDTLRLKENNLRIKFQDTSTSASFPSNDWQITANDSANGGKNKFSIDDIDGGKTPFTIEASSPANSLYVEDAGRIGLGTSTPVVQLHMVDGNTPTVRLDQDGSSGFAPQTWDLAGNEANFFIRDATNGSTLPLRIRPGAPSSSIDVAGSGNVGIGTDSPQASLHIKETDQSETTHLFEITGNPSNTQKDLLIISNNGNAFFDGPIGIGIDNATWTPDAELKLEIIGNALISGNLELGSSRTIKNNIESLNTEEALQTVAMLEPVKFQYKTSPKEDSIGFIAEDVPDMVATNSRKSVSTMDIVAVLTKVVQEQQQSIDELNTTITRLEVKLENIKSEYSDQKAQ